MAAASGFGVTGAIRRSSTLAVSSGVEIEARLALLGGDESEGKNADAVGKFDRNVTSSIAVNVRMAESESPVDALGFVGLAS